LELGTYNDQETAILVNDINEMNEGRFENLHLLCPFDGPFLRLFRGYKWVRGERVDIGFIHELVSSRVTSVGGPTSSPLAKREPRERKNVSKFGSEIAPEKKKKKKKKRKRKGKGENSEEMMEFPKRNEAKIDATSPLLLTTPSVVPQPQSYTNSYQQSSIPIAPPQPQIPFSNTLPLPNSLPLFHNFHPPFHNLTQDYVAEVMEKTEGEDIRDIQDVSLAASLVNLSSGETTHPPPTVQVE